MEAGRIVTAEEAERRVLMLVNPSMSELVIPRNQRPVHVQLLGCYADHNGLVPSLANALCLF